MRDPADALVVGAGPAGAATAILLARAGWQVVLVEQDAYPRRKVCGECIPAGTLTLLDELGIGDEVRVHAGPELRRIGWLSESTTLTADFPACTHGPYRYGRVLRRDFLDALLVERARSLGVTIVQPAKVRNIHGVPGAFRCDIQRHDAAQCLTLDARVVVDAHGSWQPGPRIDPDSSRTALHHSPLDSQLFAFKAVFGTARLEPGLLPVITLPGGYGGMVVADQDLTTLACCLRRDALSACRRRYGASAGEAVEALLRERVPGVRHALQGAKRVGHWLAVGPLRTGRRVSADNRLFRVGNAAGESHPLVGEGIAMALQSAALLSQLLAGQPPAAIAAHHAALQRSYAAAWRVAFSRRLDIAAVCAHIAMRPMLALPVNSLLGRWPALLPLAARFAGKTRAFVPLPTQCGSA